MQNKTRRETNVSLQDFVNLFSPFQLNLFLFFIYMNLIYYTSVTTLAPVSVCFLCAFSIFNACCCFLHVLSICMYPKQPKYQSNKHLVTHPVLDFLVEGIINLTDRRFADLFLCSIRFNSLLRSTNTYCTFRCLQVFICRHVNYIFFPLLGLEIKILNKTFD